MVVAGAVIVSACAATPVPRDALILDDIHIVDVDDGCVRQHQSVVIVAGRIHSITPSAKSRWPRDVHRVNLRGRYLTPALYDAHVHIFDERDLQLYALMGVQMVRNMDGWPWHLDLRDAAAPAQAWTARMVTSGPQYQRPAVATPAQMRAVIAENQAAGYDWVKLYDHIDRDMLAAIADEPQEELRVTGHLPDEIGLNVILDAGVYDDIAHAEELLAAMKIDNADWRQSLDDVADRLKATSTALTTTLVSNKMIAEQAADFAGNIARPEVAYAPPLLQMFWESDFNPNKHLDEAAAARLADNVDDLLELVAALADRGVVIIAGTDSPNPTTVPAYSLYEELQLLTEAGLTPVEAIRSATVNAAAQIDHDKTAGRIVVGAPADFIVTNANPLDDVAALRSFDALVYDGSYKSRAEIDAELEALRSAYAADLEYMRRFTPDGPAPLLDAISMPTGLEPISEPGLRSLIWIYMKFGNLDAAASVAAALQSMYPSDASKANVAYIRELLGESDVHRPDMHHGTE